MESNDAGKLPRIGDCSQEAILIRGTDCDSARAELPSCASLISPGTEGRDGWQTGVAS